MVCYFWSFLVPELVARGVIHQLFPLHEQRILNQLMTSWVQAVCESQPLGGKRHICVLYIIRSLLNDYIKGCGEKRPLTKESVSTV